MAKEVVTSPGAMYNALTHGSKIVGKIVGKNKTYFLKVKFE